MSESHSRHSVELYRPAGEAPIILVIGEQSLPEAEIAKPDTPPLNQINKRTSVKSEKTQL
jgi:hypothetical protein